MVFCTISHLNSINQEIHETKAFFTKLYYLTYGAIKNLLIKYSY